MGVEVDRRPHHRFHATDEPVRVGRGQQAGHVFDAQCIRAEILEPLGQLDEPLDAMDRTGRVADRRLDVFARAAHCRDRLLHVPHVVQRVKDPEHIHAVRRGPFNERIDHVVGIVPVADQILPAQQHLQARAGHHPLERAQAFPRIFFEETKARIEGRAAPDL